MSFATITVHCRRLIAASALELEAPAAPGAANNFMFEIDGLAFDVFSPSTMSEQELGALRDDLGEEFEALCALPPGVLSAVEIQLVGERHAPAVTEHDWAAHLAVAFEGTWASEAGETGDELSCPDAERAEALELLRANVVALE